MELSISNKKHPNYRLYTTHRSMLRRCYNIKDSKYPIYGGRGISVCERWHDINNFISDIGAKPSSKHSLERKNVHGNYCPDNCKWATAKEQANNRQYHRLFIFKGESLNLVQICEQVGANYDLVACRIYQQKWSLDKALRLKPNQKDTGNLYNCIIAFHGSYIPLKALCRLHKVSYPCVFARFQKGLTLSEALANPLPIKRLKPTKPVKDICPNLTERCNYLGLNYLSVYRRLHAGWGVEEAFNTPMESKFNQKRKR